MEPGYATSRKPLLETCNWPKHSKHSPFHWAKEDFTWAMFKWINGRRWQELPSCFPAAYFDLVHIRNALDHSFDPLLGNLAKLGMSSRTNMEVKQQA